MSDQVRGILIRVALIGMLGCYYASGLIADGRPSADDGGQPESSDLRHELERLATGGFSDPHATELAAMIGSELARRGEAGATEPSQAGAEFSPDMAASSITHQLRSLREGIYSSQFQQRSLDLAGRSAAIGLMAEHCNHALRDAALELATVCRTDSQTAAAAVLRRAERAFDQWQTADKSDG